MGKLLRARERAVARRLQHELAICAIFRDEAPFFAEWLAFHFKVGATHFYLYNNGSTDNFEGVLRPWCNKGSSHSSIGQAPRNSCPLMRIA